MPLSEKMTRSKRPPSKDEVEKYNNWLAETERQDKELLAELHELHHSEQSRKSWVRYWFGRP